MRRSFFPLRIDENALTGCDGSPSGTKIGELSMSSNMKYGPEPFVPCRSRLKMASYKGPVQVSMIAHSLGKTTRACPVRLNCLRNCSIFEFAYENSHIRGTRLRWIFLNPGSASYVAPSCDECQIRVPRRVSYCSTVNLTVPQDKSTVNMLCHFRSSSERALDNVVDME
jgi:hypothetical protein